ncbi:hypothetical protein IQ07DRAFT_641075 [Pyrenochaeta sp. DS3sAY3a]|nr:hypothetical protein IQ07DRAFT_641075 [Pyrenochaeta sp. DS3sAY3a]
MSHESVPPSSSSHSLITHSLSETLRREMPQKFRPNICVPHYHYPLSASYPRPTTTVSQFAPHNTDLVTITRTTHAKVPLSTHYRSYRNPPTTPTAKPTSSDPTCSDDDTSSNGSNDSNDSTTLLLPTATKNITPSSTGLPSQPVSKTSTIAPGSPYPTTPSTLHPTRASFFTHGIHTLPTPSTEVPPYALCSLCYRRFINDTAFQNPRLAFTIMLFGG